MLIVIFCPLFVRAVTGFDRSLCAAQFDYKSTYETHTHTPAYVTHQRGHMYVCILIKNQVNILFVRFSIPKSITERLELVIGLCDF